MSKPNPKSPLTDLAKYSKVPLKDLEKKYESLVKQRMGDKDLEKRLRRPLTEEEAQKWAVLQLKQRLGKGAGLFEAGTSFTGFVWGSSPVADFVEMIRRKARRIIDQEGVEAAYNQGLIDRDENILDTRKKVNFKDNPYFNKPLSDDESSIQKTVIGIFGKGSSVETMQDPKLHRITLTGKDALHTNLRTFEWITVRGNEGTPRKYKHYKTLKIATPMKDFGEPVLDVESYIAKSIDNIMNVYELRRDFELQMVSYSKAKTPRNVLPRPDQADIKVVKAWVGKIDPTLSDSTQERTIVLFDEQEENNPEGSEEERRLVVKVPEHIPLDFGEGSLVYVVGHNNWIPREEDELPYLLFRAFGIYAVPEYWSPPLKDSENEGIEVSSQ